jgi:hypothetical protein
MANLRRQGRAGESVANTPDVHGSSATSVGSVNKSSPLFVGSVRKSYEILQLIKLAIIGAAARRSIRWLVDGNFLAMFTDDCNMCGYQKVMASYKSGGLPNGQLIVHA